ncbi:hypothetical protein SY88_07520 [Clostridiales bacterium PH28_bin88]|nr:hypothetical protein SY88_07520 [Clostridiales bacterium PH28_bin88]
MTDICVIFASENETIAEKLVLLLRRSWNVWWAGDIAQGDWEKEVRSQISSTKAVVPVFSYHTADKKIFRDELRFAEKQERLIYPFFIDEVEPPLGFGHLNRTDAFGWNGDENHPGYKQLKQKIVAKLGEKQKDDNNLERTLTLKLENKSFKLPCFIFSLSSHETQVSPKDGVKLFQLLKPAATLISAYDAWKYMVDKDIGKDFFNSVYELRQSSCTIVLDSGNYEAFRKDDRYSEENKKGWQKNYFREIAGVLSPDIAFSFDEVNPQGDIDEVADRIIRNFRQDEKAISPLDFPLCPIIHLPDKYEGTLAGCASQLVAKVTSELKPVMVAIPERELGDGLVERVRTVRDIRKALNNLGKYYPFHLLGTGNPISMIAFAAAGADSFDGLEWCRTVADYNNGYLFHFQHFDFFSDHCLSRLQSHEIRRIIENPNASYVARVLSYNIDFFSDWTKTMQDMIAAGQVEHLLKYIPIIGTKLFKELMLK